ncbi:MAG: hypothetical protein WC007_10545 [Pelobacteraceae bacterium]
MKRIFLGVLAMMMLVMTGCGGGSVEVVVPIEPAIYPPSITSYQYSKDTVREFVNGSINFNAPDSDIDSMTVVVFDSRGYEIARTTAALNLPGVSQGTVLFSIDYVTYPADKFTFSIYLTDFNGYTSNQVVDTFWVP